MRTALCRTWSRTIFPTSFFKPVALGATNRTLFFPYPKPKAPPSQITILLTYSFQTYVFDSDRTSMTKCVLEVWSVRRFRAWRRGLMQPIRQVIIRICPLHTNPKNHKVKTRLIRQTKVFISDNGQVGGVPLVGRASEQPTLTKKHLGVWSERRPWA